MSVTHRTRRGMFEYCLLGTHDHCSTNKVGGVVRFALSRYCLDVGGIISQYLTMYAPMHQHTELGQRRVLAGASKYQGVRTRYITSCPLYIWMDLESSKAIFWT